VLRSGNKPHDDPWDWLEKIADRRSMATDELYQAERLTEEELRRDPLA
jgi:hypothetical protein